MTEQFEITRTGVVVAFDADSGEILHVNEIFEEVAPGYGDKGAVPGEEDRRSARDLAQAAHASRKIDVVAMAQSDIPPDDEDEVSEWRIDVKARKLSKVARPDLAPARKG